MSIDVAAVTPDRPDLLAALHEVRVATEAELNPDDPAPTRAEVAGELFSRSARSETCGWVALDEDVPVGEIVVDFEHTEGNDRIATVSWVGAVPQHRRRGVATALMATALDHASSAGRASLLCYLPKAPGREANTALATAWAERLGLTRRIEERVSRLHLEDLDEDLLASWQAAGRSRTDGYTVVQFSGPVPDEHMDALVDAQAAMGDMPIDDMEWTHPTEDAAFITSADEARRARGMETVRTLIVAPDGSGAAVSELHANTHRPSLAYQGDTGVVRAHRGRGLGRWIKAENLAFARPLHPTMAVIETYNAESNPWMLDINVAMGFRPHLGWIGHQGDLATARSALS